MPSPTERAMQDRIRMDHGNEWHLYPAPDRAKPSGEPVPEQHQIGPATLSAQGNTPKCPSAALRCRVVTSAAVRQSNCRSYMLSANAFSER